MKPTVEEAIEEIKAMFPGDVTVREDSEGGAFVIVESAPLSSPYTQKITWLGTHVLFNYPQSDTYPHFIRGDLSRSDGATVQRSGISPNQTFENRPALQLSRRSNRHDPRRDTAALKILRVLAWLMEG
jgi:hypothetical protein